MARKLRNSPTELKALTTVNYFSTVGGSLGRCLADINKYESVGDFVFDLSKRSVISGGFNYVATQVPLVGILFVTGGFSYTLFGIFSKEHTTNTKKFQQVGYVTFDVASTIGTGLLGAAIGQALIPVPFLGAFVGAMVGGFVGEMSGKAFINFLESRRFEKMISELYRTMQPAGYWDVTEETLDIIDLNYKTFENSIPERLQSRFGSNKYWFAMIGFTILSFSEAKKRAEYIR
jgi:hypothetical protein